jgi:PAS domain S-box-containing protein
MAAYALSAGVTIAAAVVLAGWTLELPILTTFGARGVSMNPLTAVCFLLVGVALLVTLPEPARPIERWIGRALAVTATAFAVTKLLMLGRANGPDSWLFRAAVDAMSPVNRMAPNTAAIMIPVALSVACLDVDIRGIRPARLLVLLSMPLTLVVGVGFLFGVEELYGWGAYIPMARGTAVTFVALQLAVIAGRIEHGVTRLLVASGAGGVAARRLLPSAILLPLVLGYVRLAGQRRGFYGPEFGTVLFSLAMIAVVGVLGWWTARSVDALEHAHAVAEAQLQALIRHTPLAIVVLDMNGVARLCNEAFVELFHYPESMVLGHRIDDFIAPRGDAGETVDMTRRGLAGEAHRFETVRRRRDGRLVQVELFVVPLVVKGQAVGTFGIYRDLGLPAL